MATRTHGSDSDPKWYRSLEGLAAVTPWPVVAMGNVLWTILLAPELVVLAVGDPAVGGTVQQGLQFPLATLAGVALCLLFVPLLLVQTEPTAAVDGGLTDDVR